jgi:nuclear transport factor 2 (NTF2) superfamily protein
VTHDIGDRLSLIYAAFNARDIETVLSALHADVDWPNGMSGGRVRGRDAVRSYWTEQWQTIDPIVTPTRIDVLGDGRVDVDVHQVVRDLSGTLLVETTVHHVYTLDACGLITAMEICAN